MVAGWIGEMVGSMDSILEGTNGSLGRYCIWILQRGRRFGGGGGCDDSGGGGGGYSGGGGGGSGRESEIPVVEVVVPTTQELNKSILPGQIMDMVR